MTISLRGLLQRAPRPVLGIDVSASRVKLVELGPGRRAPMRLERYAIEPIAPGAIVDGNVEQPEAVADALVRAVRRSGTRARLVAMALPSSAVICRRISLPAGLSEEEYEQRVESEASQYVPFPIDEVNLDFQVLGPGARADEDVEVLLAACRRERVEDRVAIAETAGLRPVVVDVEPHAARAAIDLAAAGLPDVRAGQVLAVFDIGHARTAMTVVLDGQTVFEREQPFGGGPLTLDIARRYGLPVEEAEARKRSGELPADYAGELLAPFVEQAATEVARALQLVFTSTPLVRVDRILLAGGVAVTAGLVEAVAARTGVATAIASPFRGMELGAAVREDQLGLDAPALLIGCGLAMRGFDA